MSLNNRYRVLLEDVKAATDARNGYEFLLHSGNRDEIELLVKVGLLEPHANTKKFWVRLTEAGRAVLKSWTD